MHEVRQLLPDAVANFRDCGGVIAATGWFQSRRLLRTSALGGLSARVLDQLTEILGPCDYFDLRTNREVDRDGGAEWLTQFGWQWIRLPVNDQEDGTDLVERYQKAMPAYRSAARVILGHLTPTRPAVIGCSLGKDRTGMVTALIQRWLGVSRSDIGRDFELSNHYLKQQRHLLPTRWRKGKSPVTPVSSSACLEALDYVSVEDFPDRARAILIREKDAVAISQGSARRDVE